MSDANAYSANLPQLQAAKQQIAKLGGEPLEMLGKFLDGLAATRDWEGNDSYGKSIRPNLEREGKTTTETMQALAGAIAAIATGTNDNAKNIQDTQDRNLEAIQQSIVASDTSSGRH